MCETRLGSDMRAAVPPVERESGSAVSKDSARVEVCFCGGGAGVATCAVAAGKGDFSDWVAGGVGSDDPSGD
jgi:hypothetical protein